MNYCSPPPPPPQFSFSYPPRRVSSQTHLAISPATPAGHPGLFSEPSSPASLSHPLRLLPPPILPLRTHHSLESFPQPTMTSYRNDILPPRPLSLDTTNLVPSYHQSSMTTPVGFPPSPADSCSSTASEFPPLTPPLTARPGASMSMPATPGSTRRPPVHVICTAPLVAPKPLPYHSPTFIQFDLPDMDEDLSRNSSVLSTDRPVMAGFKRPTPHENDEESESWPDLHSDRGPPQKKLRPAVSPVDDGLTSAWPPHSIAPTTTTNRAHNRIRKCQQRRITRNSLSAVVA